MCLKALASLLTGASVYFDLAYAHAIKLTENGWILVVETDFNASELLVETKTELESQKTVIASDIRSCSLDRLVRKFRPSHQLQRNSSESSVRSDCSERLHEYLKLQESLSSFPRFQEPSFPFWRKKPAKGKHKHRSLQGKTVPKRPQQQPTPRESNTVRMAGPI